MYILIDRGQMAITHVHQDRKVLAWLSWIECTNSGAIMDLSSIRPLLEFSATELKLIYKNSTGAELKGYANSLAQAVLDMAKRLPPSVCNAAEVEAQAKCINDGDKSHFSYLIGSLVPKEHVGLFEPPFMTVPRVEAEELRAASGYSAPAFAGTAHQSTPAGTNPLPREPRAPSAPRTGGSRATIFEVADQMWVEAGSPTTLNVVLALRKSIMQALEDNHSIKKTTSSTALGDWQKNRIQ